MSETLRTKSIERQARMGEDAVQTIRDEARDAFARHNPDARRIKLITHMHLVCADSPPTTPLEWYFPANVKNSTIFQFTHLEIGSNQSSLLLKIKTAHGMFWIMASTVTKDVKLTLASSINEDDRKVQANIVADFTNPSQEACTLTLTHIDPYTCTFCGGRCGTKCSLCWTNLGISVRYCDRSCQKEHYPMHKHVCGKKV
jgi:hypothetical protein